MLSEVKILFVIAIILVLIYTDFIFFVNIYLKKIFSKTNLRKSFQSTKLHKGFLDLQSQRIQKLSKILVNKTCIYDYFSNWFVLVKIMDLCKNFYFISISRIHSSLH